MNILAENSKIVKIKVGSGGVANNDLVMISSGTVVKCGAAAAAVGIVGIARGTYDADEIAEVAVYEGGQIIEAFYTGTTKTSLADADLGKAFGVDGPTIVDLDDTSNGVAVCVGYNNTVGTINFLIPAAKRHL